MLWLLGCTCASCLLGGYPWLPTLQPVLTWLPACKHVASILLFISHHCSGSPLVLWIALHMHNNCHCLHAYCTLMQVPCTGLCDDDGGVMVISTQLCKCTYSRVRLCEFLARSVQSLHAFRSLRCHPDDSVICLILSRAHSIILMTWLLSTHAGAGIWSVCDNPVELL